MTTKHASTVPTSSLANRGILRGAGVLVLLAILTPGQATRAADWIATRFLLPRVDAGEPGDFHSFDSSIVRSFMPADTDTGYEDGRALVDLDGDGDLDFCRVVGGPFPDPFHITCKLFDSALLRFTTEITSGVIDPGFAAGRGWIDVDGDGDTDFCRVIDTFPPGPPFGISCQLFDRPSFSFSGEVGNPAILGSDPGQDSSRAWIDVDGDGDGDYCAVMGSSPPQLRCSFFEPGRGFPELRSFELLGLPGPKGAPTHDPGYLEGRAWVDVDGDGIHDYCRVIGGPLPIPFKVMCTFLPLGGGTFARQPIALSPRVVISPDLDPGFADSRAWVDADGDGDIDYCRLVGGPLSVRCLLFERRQFSSGFGAEIGSGPIDPGFPEMRSWTDANGDRKADYCRVVGAEPTLGIECTLSTGSGFGATVQTLFSFDRPRAFARADLLVADLDRDGVAEASLIARGDCHPEREGRFRGPGALLSPNGCSGPQLVPGVQDHFNDVFREPCNNHDRCYATPWWPPQFTDSEADFRSWLNLLRSPAGDALNKKTECDRRFRNDMGGRCREYVCGNLSDLLCQLFKKEELATCLVTADLYHAAVLGGGFDAFEGNQNVLYRQCPDALADLELTPGQPSPARFKPGGPGDVVDIPLTIRNSSDADRAPAQGIVLAVHTDDIPRPRGPEQPPTTCGQGGAAPDGSCLCTTATCVLPPIPKGQTRNVILRVDTSAATGGTIDLLARIASNRDPNPGNSRSEITLVRVNEAPSFAGGGPVAVLEDSGPNTLQWASAVAPGPPWEAGQSVQFELDPLADPLLASGPALDPSGLLTFTPAADANGTATFSAVLADDGGTEAGGSDRSGAQPLEITVVPVNDAPSFTHSGDLDLPTGTQGATVVAGWVTGVLLGPADEQASQAIQAYTTTTVADAERVLTEAPAVANDGTLTVTTTGRPGTARVDVRLIDDGGTENGGADTSLPATVAITVADDFDGVPAATENDAPGDGDGNDDGVPDSGQPHVASLPSLVTGEFWTVALEGCPQIESAEALTLDALPPDPSASRALWGLLRLELPCAEAVVRLQVHADTTSANRLRRYGPARPGDAATESWSELVFAREDDVWVFSLADGAPGDDTGADGRIVLRLAPAVGPRLTEIPTLGTVGLALLGLLLLVVGLHRSRLA